MNDLKIDFAKTNRNFFVATNKLAQNLTENNEKDNNNKGKTESTWGRNFKKTKKAVNSQTFEELGLLLFFLYI